MWRVVVRGMSYYSLGRGTVGKVARLLRMERAREVKYVVARRRGREKLLRALSMVREEFEIGYVKRHIALRDAAGLE